MRFNRGLAGFTLIACSLLVLTSPAFAARRSGLAGSLLIEDKDDLFFFPHQVLTYRNLIALDYGPSSGSGNGLITLGDDSMAFGVAVHRGDVMTPHAINELAALGGPASLFGPPFDPAAATPATLVDFLFGTGSPDSAFGFRLGLGRGSEVTTIANVDDSESEMFVMGEIGYGAGTRGQDTRFDLGVALTLDLGAVETGGMDDASGTHLGVSGLVRAFVPMETTMDLGLLANIAVISNAVTDEMAPGSPSIPSVLAFSLGGGIGPAFRFGPASVAAYGILRAVISNTDPNSEVNDNETSAHDLVIPGVHLAAEVPIADWLYVRTGAEYSFNIEGTSAPGDSGTSSNSGSFGWNAGLGVVINDFRFDGSLQQGFVTNGPDFIGGSNGGFFAIASLSYNFDKARSGAAPVTEPVAEEPAPAPPPEPVAEPTPTAPLEPAPPPPMPEPANPEAGIGGGAQIQVAPAPAAPAPPPP